ncbi:AbrB/MazE/SpoVT family DNA-binding domain-containing protein [Methanosarcina sp. UBA5]|uniref:AbrB/MazE/SpoVT family DNA-binding domain-containing protein n=1 Tax=Methanosarcina sp. UBA5 TaxID=1915593 RepID=UPI0025DDFC21|nr:AbrB/MazE/SpoVT family DNA-binding domain-containing protein [Methanosarcina sp. UBA5]
MVLKMLKRKIQTTGKGSFIITLPKSIVLAIGLKKGMDFGIELETNRIMLTPVPVTRQDEVGTEDPAATV